MPPKNCRDKSCGILVAAIALLICASVPGFGQTGSASPSPSPSPMAEKGEAQLAPVNYFFPDLPPGSMTHQNKAFSVKVGIAVLADHTFIGQNSSSRAQVGPQASKFDLRAARVMFSGEIKFKRPWTYLIAGDFNEFRLPEDRVFEGLDFALTIPLWQEARITIGKQKEPFVYEMVGDAANLPQQERVLSPFFTSRNIGIRYQDNYLKDRMSFSVGVYNDWFRSNRSFEESGTQVSGRLTGLPIESKDGREFLHLGVAFRHLGADEGQLRYKGRPESNVTDNYVDTDTIPGRYARQLALEGLYNTGPFSVLAEYAQAWVASTVTGNPTFNGFYVTGSYVLTGENRPYDKKVGYARRIIPRSRWGAIEVVGRFGYVDLDDTLVNGGKMRTWYSGVNWWASRQWKIGAGYGLADLDKFGTTGRTQRLHTRLQWIY
jgi:phosphate-selective porin OprO and OprP